MRINFIPRDGGNRFAAATFFTFTNGGLAGSNFTDELKAAGLTTPNEVKKNWDLNASAGGPIKRDKLWFWFSSRYIGVESWAPVAENLNAYKPSEFLYVPSHRRAGSWPGVPTTAACGPRGRRRPRPRLPAPTSRTSGATARTGSLPWWLPRRRATSASRC